MNKKLFALICSLILFQYVKSESDCAKKEKVGDTELVCTGETTSDANIYKCVVNGNKCEEKLMTCTEEKPDITDEKICQKLSVGKGKVCKLDKTKKECIEEDDPSKNGANNLKYSLALLIFLFLF
jgi:hypothetical protein